MNVYVRGVMTAALLDGKKLAESVRATTRAEAAQFFARHGRAPSLHLVFSSAHDASVSYTASKARAAGECGIHATLHPLPGGVSEDEVERLLAELSADIAVDAILLQLPLAPPLREARLLERIAPEKDVDGLHPFNVGRLAEGRPTLSPCTPLGVLRLIESAGGTIAGARAVVVGRSALVGRPVAALLLAADATVTIAHRKTRDLPSLCREADILVVAAGSPGLVRGDWVKEGAVVIDVGNNAIDDHGKSRVVGDVAFDEARERAAAITPVPGGVGPMTVACLLANTLRAACLRAGDS